MRNLNGSIPGIDETWFRAWGVTDFGLALNGVVMWDGSFFSVARENTSGEPAIGPTPLA